MTATNLTLAASALAPPNRVLAGAEAVALLKRFPARPRLTSWPETAATRDEVIARLRQPPLRVKGHSTQDSRMVGVRILLSWLETFPGDTCQRRWEASPIAAEPEKWYEKVREWTPTADRATKSGHLQAGLLALLCADVVRPDTTWLAVNYSRHLRPALARSRAPEGSASLEAWIPQNVRVTPHASEALAALAQVLATRGGKLQDMVVGDLLERCYAPVAYNRTTREVRLAYLWLRERGQFPRDAPTTLLFTTHRAGQVTPAELVDRYDLKCQPVRDLLVDYLTERQPTLDYATLKSLAAILLGNFSADLEQHHPGIDSVRLSPDTATAWKTASRRGPPAVGKPTEP